MTIDSLLKSAKSAYKGERANLICETLLAHFLGKNRVFLHANSEKKIQDILHLNKVAKSNIVNSPLDLHSADFEIFEASQTPSLVSSSKIPPIGLRSKKNHESQTENSSVACECKIAESGKNTLSLRDSTQRVESWQSTKSTHDSAPHFTSAHSLKCALLKSISLLNNGFPLEYITKKASFYGMDFFIDCGALIPRPETELLVDKATQLIATHNISQIYEIGVGSGIIAISLCLLNPRIHITATDISPTALKIAQKNIALKSAVDFTLKSRIRLICTDLLKGTNFAPKDSLIISNPPYIAEDYALPRNVAFEPKIALFGGKKGDEILQKIIALNADFLCCEIAHNQSYLAEALGAYKSVEFYKDYAGFTRGFVAKRD